MTLIASTLNFKMPFILSDILCTIEETSPETGQNVKEIAFKQKMYFIKNKTCIVFAGESPEIFIFLTVFKDWFQHREITKENIDSFLQGYDLDKHFGESAFFITHIENLAKGRIFVNQFYYPRETNLVDRKEFVIKDGLWNIMEDPIYEEVSANGSGTSRFLNIVNESVKFESQYPEGDFLRTVQTNTSLIARLLALDLFSDYTSEDGWGGGFETAYYNGNKFEKIDDIAYLISHSQFDLSGDIGIPNPQIISYYKYRNDILYIVELRLRKPIIAETEIHFIFNYPFGEYSTTLFEVEGIDEENIYKHELPKDLSFTTDKIAVGYALITPKNCIYNPAFFNIGPEVSINFEQGNKIEIVVDKKIMENIKKISLEQFPRLMSSFPATSAKGLV